MATKAKEPDTLRIWNAVCRTDPRHTKRVSQRGGFTAIDAQYQIKMATEQFGPIGEGWGYEVGRFEVVNGLIVVPVTLWHSGDREKTFGPILGCAEMFGKHPDRDAPKKAITDAITKGLSQLGFNADVFLGMFDDNKYVERVAKEFAANDEPNKRVKLDGPHTSLSPLKAAIKSFVATLTAMTDLGEFTAYMETPEVVALEKQAIRDLPEWWETGEGMPAEFEPVASRIERKRRELTEIDEIANASGARYVNAG